MRLCALLPVALTGLLAGCMSFYPVETTPRSVIETIEPGDTVRLTTRSGGELIVRVWSVSDVGIRGRVEGNPADVRIPLDRLQAIEIERLNLKKAALTTILPAVIAAAIACNNRDCDTHAGLTATY